MNRITTLFCCLLSAAALTSCDKIRALDPYNTYPELLEEWDENVPSLNFVLHLQPRTDDTGTSLPITREQLSQTMDACAQRLTALGVTRLFIGEYDEASLLVRVSSDATKNPESLRMALEKSGHLQMHKVGERSSELGLDGRTLAERVLAGDEIVPGQFALSHQFQDYDGNTLDQPILLYRRMALDSSDIRDTFPSPSRDDAVGVTLTQKGGEKMKSLTQNMQLGVDRIAILIDNEVVTAPTVQAVLGRRFEISGTDDASLLAAQLMHPLENPVNVEIIATSDIKK